MRLDEYIVEKRVREAQALRNRIAGHVRGLMAELENAETVLDEARKVAIQMERVYAGRTVRRHCNEFNYCQAVIDLVAEEMGVPVERILSEHRNAVDARARQIAMWICSFSMLSQYQIARQFRRDRTTVTHATNRVEELRLDNEAFCALTDELKRKADEIGKKTRTSDGEAA